MATDAAGAAVGFLVMQRSIPRMILENAALAAMLFLAAYAVLGPSG
jgi:hypothetical protein